MWAIFIGSQKRIFSREWIGEILFCRNGLSWADSFHLSRDAFIDSYRHVSFRTNGDIAYLFNPTNFDVSIENYVY